MTELRREEIRNHAVGCRLTPIPNTNPIVVQGLWTDLERFATAIYAAGVKKGKSIPMKYRRMEFNAQLQKELVIERAVSDRLLEALKAILPDAEDNDYGGPDTGERLADARTAIAEVEAMRKEK